MFFIEGNIGSGKSTFLSKLAQVSNANIVYEPVDEWIQIKNADGTNLLEEFYGNQTRYAYTFQSIAFRTRVKNLTNLPSDKKNIVERSIFTDRNVFAKTCYETGKMNDIEWSDYCSWFDWLTNDAFSIKPDGYIYLRADPKVSYERIKKRSRGGEETIPYEYIKNLHDKHDEWLLNVKGSILVLNVNEDFENNPEQLKKLIKHVELFINT